MLRVTILIFIQLCVQVDPAEDTLKLVHVMFRHCDRTPDKKELYLKSPYYNESAFAPYGYGQLTNRGKQRCYEIGQSLRDRYDSFLNASYHYSLVEATSTHFGRTKESLQLVLAGLFPPTNELKWSETLNWLPIATHYDKLGEEEIIYPSGTERYAKEFVKFMQTEEYKALEAPFKDYMDFLSKQIDEPVDFVKMSYLDLGFSLTNEFGLKLPNWTQTIFPKQVDHSFIEFIASTMGSKKLVRILGGPFFKKLIEDTEMKINGTLDPANRKLFIYAGHDITISVFFSVLGIWNRTTPAVGSHCLFEVHEINGTYGFKLFFANSSSAVPQLLFLPGFGEFVPIKQLKMQKREFIELADLDEPSLSIRPIGNLLLVLLLSYLIPKI